MPFNFLGGVTSGFMNLMAGHMQNMTTREINAQNVALQRDINNSNLTHSEKWNKMNYDMARESQDAQLAQQQWANERYVESVDYDRALQQEIFNREDTALQRAVSDATAAGFSPLAALGVPSGAGGRTYSQP